MDAIHGATYNSGRVVLLRVRLAKSFLEVGATLVPHCREHVRWSGTIVADLGRLLLTAVSHQSALDIGMLWRVEDSGGAAIVDGDHKPMFIHDLEGHKCTHAEFLVVTEFLPPAPDAHS